MVTTSIFIVLAAATASVVARDWLVERLDDDVHFQWLYDEESIEFRVTARTRGWLALGLSPTGAMRRSDVLIGWIDDVGGHMVDAFIEDVPPPTRDAKQNVHLVEAARNDTHTMLQFRRELDTCDGERDRIISGKTMSIIWALGDEQPADETLTSMTKHSKRGGRSLILVETASSADRVQAEEAFERDRQFHWDFSFAGTEVTKPTLYWCKTFALPQIDEPVQAIGFQVNPGSEQLVHHLTIFLCDPSTESADEHECFVDSPESRATRRCRQRLVYGWASGGRALDVLPAQVGMRFEPSDSERILFVELHYDSKTASKSSPRIDTSSVRVHLTRRLRAFDSDSLAVAHTSDAQLLVPPRRRTFTALSHCHSKCTRAMLPSGGVVVEAIFPHSHLLGRQISVRLFRNGTELAPLMNDDAYDFDYQQARSIRERRIYPGDHITVECVYSSEHRENVTFGGLATDDEMCIAMLRHYGTSTMAFCGSSPDIGGMMLASGASTGDILKMASNPGNFTAAARAHFQSVDWSDEALVRRVERNYRYGPYNYYCAGEGGFQRGYDVYIDGLSEGAKKPGDNDHSKCID